MIDRQIIIKIWSDRWWRMKYSIKSATSIEPSNFKYIQRNAYHLVMLHSWYRKKIRVLRCLQLHFALNDFADVTLFSSAILLMNLFRFMSMNLFWFWVHVFEVSRLPRQDLEHLFDFNFKYANVWNYHGNATKIGIFQANRQFDAAFICEKQISWTTISFDHSIVLTYSIPNISTDPTLSALK